MKFIVQLSFIGIQFLISEGRNIYAFLDLRGSRASGEEVGRDLVRMKKILDGFQHYANFPVFGPDVSSVSGAKQIRFMKDLLTNAGSSLGAVILQPKFSNDLQIEDPHELIASMTNELDTYVWNKEIRTGKPLPKKPVWIAEPTASQGSFVEAVKLVKRLGYAAKLGVQIYLRQAGVNTLRSPTPDFWFSLLYKTLVGQGVLDNKIESRNQTHLHVFSHCTPAVPQEKSVLDTDWKYEKGAVTVFGVNESPRPTKLILKVTNKEEPLHIYFLTTDTKNNSPDKIATTLLNGQSLSLSPAWELPVLSPKVKRASKSAAVTVPGESIFFVVMPDSKVRTCSIPPFSTPDLNLSELTRRLRLSPQKKIESEEDLDMVEASTEGVYVSFSKKKPPETEKMDVAGKSLMKTLMSKLAPKTMDVKVDASVEKEDIPVRYITFNENSFLNKLAEGVKEELKSDSPEEWEDPQVKYPALTAAIKKPKADVITILPLNDQLGTKKGESKDEVDHSRKRRASAEDPPIPAIKPGIMTVHIETIKQSQPLTVKDAPSDLSSPKVSLTPASEAGNDADKARNARNAGEAEGMIDDEEQNRKATLDGEDKKEDKKTLIIITPQTQSTKGDETQERKETLAEEEDDKVEITTGASEAQIKMEKDREEKETQAKTSALVEVVKETEKQEMVSDTAGGVMVPLIVPVKNLQEIMMKTTKEQSDPEPDSEPSVSQSKQESSTNEGKIPTTAGEEKPSQTEASVPTQVVMVQVPTSQSDTSLTAISPSGSHAAIKDNPMLVSESRSGETSEAGNTVGIPSTSNIGTTAANTEVSPVPLIVTPLGVDYNAKKETAINKILTGIAEAEDAKLTKLSREEAKEEEAKITHQENSKLMPVRLTDNETMYMTLEDMKTLVEAKQHPSEKLQTLPSATPELELPQDGPLSIKMTRQVDMSEATLKPRTATLAAPPEAEPTTTVRPKLTTKPKPVKLPSANQVPAAKPPTPEELRERFKMLRAKMLELKTQYIEERDRRLEEFKKQVVVAKSNPGQVADAEMIKSTIKRREAELKDWFKRFDKREAEPSSAGTLENTSKIRLSPFSDDEGMDMAKFFDDEPADSCNNKRSPAVDGTPQYQYLTHGPPEGPARKDAASDAAGSNDWDVRKEGIIINNRVYPAKLFGYVGRPDLERDVSRSEQKKSYVARDYEGESDSYKADETVPRYDPVRSRLAYVSKDAFIKEIKSDFIPIMIIPGEESNKRSKRSTLTELEEKFHQFKDEVFPKITSFLKNLSENPPWKRDLERSSRNRRSLDDVNLNDLIHLKRLTGLHRRKPELNPADVEHYVLDNLDKGENLLFTTARKYTDLAENLKAPDSSLGSKLIDKIGYCEEIGTSTKSEIRDPFQSDEPSTKDTQSQVRAVNDQTASPAADEELEDESMLLTVVADKMKSLFVKIRDLLGVGNAS